MTARCQGGCGKTVTEAGKWCPECFFAEKVGPEAAEHIAAGQAVFIQDRKIYPAGAAPDPIRPTQDLQSLRFEIHSASFHLCFGRESERAEALERLSHLVHVLQQEQHLTKKD